MLWNDVPEFDVERISSAFERRVRDACPQHASLAMRVLGRLEPGRWVIEWRLPWWIGDAFGLDRATADEIVLSNVLGLASVRLLDDIADGDVADDANAATELGDVLYLAAVEPYRRLFPPASPFWPRLDQCMTTWRSATGGAANGSDVARLAARGAPLKISAFAVCLLTGRVPTLPLLDRCLDHALAGLVLYDDLGDWRSDLAAGRWNAFVASAAGDDGSAGDVLVAMLTNDAVASYMTRSVAETIRAAELADAAGVAPLAAHLRRSAHRTEAQGAVLQAHYRDLGERAGSLLLAGPRDHPSVDRPFAATITSTR